MSIGDNNTNQPTIYMKMPGVDGFVTEKNHNNWIQLTDIQFNIKRDLHTQTGHMANREMSKPSFSSITFRKTHDAVGAMLAQEACAGSSKDTVVLHICKTGSKELKVETEITLKDVFVNAWGVTTDASNDTKAESGSLNFAHIEIKGFPYDAQGKQKTPQSFAYDLAAAQPA